MKRIKASFLMIAALFFTFVLSMTPGVVAAQEEVVPVQESLMWINHLDFVAGDPSVLTSFNAVASSVGGGTLSGLEITSTTSGENAEGGGNKVIEKGLAVPPGYHVDGVRVCYELSNPGGSYISQIRLAQYQETQPATALVMLEDPTDLIDPGPICVDSKVAETYEPIDPSMGALRLSFRVNFAESQVDDIIVVRAVGLHLLSFDLQQQIDDLQNDIVNHGHAYLTGKGLMASGAI